MISSGAFQAASGLIWWYLPSQPPTTRRWRKTGHDLDEQYTDINIYIYTTIINSILTIINSILTIINSILTIINSILTIINSILTVLTDIITIY